MRTCSNVSKNSSKPSLNCDIRMRCYFSWLTSSSNDSTENVNVFQLVVRAKATSGAEPVETVALTQEREIENATPRRAPSSSDNPEAETAKPKAGTHAELPQLKHVDTKPTPALATVLIPPAQIGGAGSRRNAMIRRIKQRAALTASPATPNTVPKKKPKTPATSMTVIARKARSSPQQEP